MPGRSRATRRQRSLTCFLRSKKLSLLAADASYCEREYSPLLLKPLALLLWLVEEAPPPAA